MCRKVKPLADFPVKDKVRGLLRSYCWDCCRAYARSHYQRNKDAYLQKARRQHKRDRTMCQIAAYEYLATHPCIDCGETDLAVLDFDHRDRSTKTAAIAVLIRRGKVAPLLAEIAKCDVRCANDHRRKTAREFGYARWTSTA